MNQSRSMVPEELRERARTIAMEFAQEIVSILEQAIADTSSALTSGMAADMGAGEKKPGRAAAPKAAAKAAPAPAPVPAAPTPAAPAPARKGAEPQADIKRRILGALRKSKTGLGAEQLNRLLGTSSSDLAAPMQELIRAGKVTKTGMARGTKYLVSSGS